MRGLFKRSATIKSACRLGTLFVCMAGLVVCYHSIETMRTRFFCADPIFGIRAIPICDRALRGGSNAYSWFRSRLTKNNTNLIPKTHLPKSKPQALLIGSPELDTKNSKSLKKTNHATQETKTLSPLMGRSSLKAVSLASSSQHPKLETKNDSLCPVIQLDPFDPIIMKHFKKYQPTDCSKGKPSLVYLDDGKLRVNTAKVKKTVRKIDFCKYAALQLAEKHDSELMTPTWSKPFLEKPIKLGADEEHLFVRCFQNGTVVGETFKSRVVEKPSMEKTRRADFQRHLETNSPVETMNVLILGMDGTSKQNFIRFMPKTRKFLLERLHAKELHKFNKVGDATFDNVIVFHAKRNVSELLKQFSYKQYFDDIDCMFLWHKYQNAGYRTAMGFDVTYGTAYHFLKKGWKRPPFDFYNRPIPLGFELKKKRFRKSGHYCVGDVNGMTILLDYLFQIASKFKNSRETPYFLYNFYSHITHDIQEMAFRADPLYLSLFQRLEKTNVLNNTIMVFFSDHGPRFGKARNTLNGKIEGNSPFVFFIFPPWFEEKYPELMKTFRRNQDRLTTFYDMHQTVLELLTFKGKSKVGSLDSVGISLFDEIPVERTCLEANIPLEYCNCLKLENGTVSKKTTQTLAQHLLHIVMDKTAKHRHKCVPLKLKSVPSVLKAVTYTKDGGRRKSYKVVIETTPGGALYEALMEYSAGNQKVKLVGKIVRLNFYKGQDSCHDELELKSFCFCKS